MRCTSSSRGVMRSPVGIWISIVRPDGTIAVQQTGIGISTSGPSRIAKGLPAPRPLARGLDLDEVLDEEARGRGEGFLLAHGHVHATARPGVGELDQAK